jgi:DMSO reductase anchor subunit
LRALALILGYGLPILLLLVPFNHWLGLLAVLTHILGILASRWLFFAEAEHVVGLYYGKR